MQSINMLKKKTYKINYSFVVFLLNMLISVTICNSIMAEDNSDAMEAAKRAIRMRDYSTALSLFHTLASSGDAEAEYQLGVFFQMGRGVLRNHAEAIEWYKKAAEKGHVKAQFNLGTMYESGWGTAPDYQMAYECYRKAAAQGHDRAELKCMSLHEGRLLMYGNTNLSKEELLIAAVKKDDLNNIVQLLNAGADINCRDKYGHTPLIEAASCGHIGGTGLLVAKGANLEIYNNEGDNALLTAVQKNQLEIVKALLEAGANVNAVNTTGSTSLMIAAIRNNPSMVQLLIDFRADVQKVDNRNQDALHIALDKGHDDVIKCLLETGKIILPSSDEKTREVFERIVVQLKRFREVKDIGNIETLENAEDRVLFERWTPLMIAAWRDEIEIVRLLLSQGENVNVRCVDGHTALSRAAWRGHADIVDLLLQAGAEIDTSTAADTSPVILAAKYGHKEVVLRLIPECISHGGAIKLMDDIVYTALSRGYGDIVEAIVNAGLIVEFKGNKQFSSLFLEAAASGQSKLIEIMLRHGADVNVTDEAGKTPLMLAVESGHKEIVELLIRQNAAIDMRDQHGHTALFRAAHVGNFDIASLLINAGSDVQIKSEYGNTPLILAVDAGNEEIARLLINQGVEIDAFNKAGDNALIVAMRRSDKNIARILLDNGAKPYVPLSKLDKVDTEMKDLLKEYRSIKSYLAQLLSKHGW